MNKYLNDLNNELYQTKTKYNEHRAEFSKWWLNEYKTVKFPPNGIVFDFYVDPQQQEMVPWENRVPKFELDPDLPLQAALVHTAGKTKITLKKANLMLTITI